MSMSAWLGRSPTSIISCLSAFPHFPVPLILVCATPTPAARMRLSAKAVYRIVGTTDRTPVWMRIPRKRAIPRPELRLGPINVQQPARLPGDTEIAMPPKQITRERIFRLLIGGFGLVILLLAAATVVGIRNIQHIQAISKELLREQSVSRGLIDELQSQQTSLSEVISVLSRDPDSVDYARITTELDEADRDIDRIVTEGERTPERDLWMRLRRSSTQFTSEARRLLPFDEAETFQSLDLFRHHGEFASVVARLWEAESRK